MTDGPDTGWTWRQPAPTVTEHGDGTTVIGNARSLETPPDSLGGWLHAHASTRPDQPFLRQRERGPDTPWREVTYAAAARRVNQLSHGLVGAGLADRPVAILSENSIEMGLITLAAAQIGQPVVPISVAYSLRARGGGHIGHILELTDPGTLVVSDADTHLPALRAAGVSPATGGPRVLAVTGAGHHDGIDPLAELEAGHPEELSGPAADRAAGVGPETVAKIQFTSGSTALPKGVAVTHGMLTSNVVGITQMWPSLSSDEVLCDWLPWNHTFGGNFVFDLVLERGATLHVDGGTPTPDGMATTTANLREVRPTILFNVPRGYTALLEAMRHDDDLRRAVFSRCRAMFVAAAALDQGTWTELRDMSAEVRGEPVALLAGWGATETAPDATLVFWPVEDARVIGLPIPGVEVKLSPVGAGRRELRVRGPNITPGYHRDPEATATAFDAEGFYCTGDAGALLDPDDPAAGLIFAGRIGEDFKLDTGVWVRNADLRASIHDIGQPLLVEVVPAAPNRSELAALLFPDVPALRERLPEASGEHPDDAAFVRSGPVAEQFRRILQEHNADATGSSSRVIRFSVLTTPPDLDANETTDKGYVNQSAVLDNRRELVEDLYADPLPEHVHRV